ncbi:MAG: transporter [Acidobacteria bacterium]|nr:transporter [Acidobacteriota bacterium]
MTNLSACLFFAGWLLTCVASFAGEDQQSSLGTAWFKLVSRTQAEQPHWITPVVTVTPRLEQEFRYDISRQQRPPGGDTTTIYGGGKGLELIPAERVEIILGIPSYLAHSGSSVLDGWGDFSFLVKYRLAAENEEGGNYIVTAFLGGTVPTGTNKNGAEHPVITPTIALGKGWGDFSVLSTLGVGLPTADGDRLGRPVSHNTAFQYRLHRKLWPELEVNSTYWLNGDRAGKKQVFLTPGLVVGRIPLRGRLGLTLGTGFQIAATHFHAFNHTFNHTFIFTIRLPFS